MPCFAVIPANDAGTEGAKRVGMNNARWSGLIGLCLVACAPSSDPIDGKLQLIGSVGDKASPVVGTSYVEAGEFLQDEEDIATWWAIRREAAATFQYICDGLFCQGDHEDLTSLDFTCSVSSKQGRLRECGWTFAASAGFVNGLTGEIDAQTHFYVCTLRPKGTIKDLLEALAEDPVGAPLPGIDQSFFDILEDCFQSPLESEPPPARADGPFVAVSAEVESWQGIVSALQRDFDDRCGDTFCEGDYTNLTALGLTCSAHSGTGRIGHCNWSFAGSDSSVKRGGQLEITRAAFDCSFQVDGTSAELLAALAGADEATVSLLERPLPRTTKTLYDVLVDCL